MCIGDDINTVSFFPSIKGSIDIMDYSSTDSSRPVAMATGYLQRYQSMVQMRKQVVVVLLSDWMVICLDHTLKLLWKAQVEEREKETLHYSIS